MLTEGRFHKYLRESLLYVPPFRKGRHINIYPDDTYFVAYPKSGSVWLTFMICSMLAEEESMDFEKAKAYMPDVYMHYDLKLRSRKRPRYLKSHEYLHPDYPKVAYLVRDPRAVAVSYFYFLKKYNKIRQEATFKEYLPYFVRGEIDKYGPWDKHVMGWLGANETSRDFLFLRYEDLKAQPLENIKKVADFLKLNPSEEKLVAAIEANTLDKMKVAEERTLKEGRKDIPFVREGKSKGWESEFDQESMELLLSNFGWAMKRLNYDF